MNKLLVILGPTATGKTDLALQLASKFQGELVSVDSRQVYVGLDIGTGKLPSSGRWKVEDGRWIVNGISIHLYDVISPQNQYTVADYVKDATRVIEDIRKRGKLPIMVGGTGLYLKALLKGLPNLSVPVDKKLRKKLQELSLKDLQNKLQKIAPERWQNMNYSDRQNPRRLIRYIELTLKGASVRNWIPAYAGMTGHHVLKIGLTAPRQVLYKRVDERVVNRINQGMIDETEKLHRNGLSFKRMKQLGLEYGVLADYLSGEINGMDQLVKAMQGKIHRFIRRQLTWFKKERDVNWFDITDKDFPINVEKVISKWYHQAT